MNRLRRMVLVNSAKVAYREVELDGHIHFIGTQGTGKSTLLRALLFFYNADSRKLGISAEKRAFADYYFPYADSYIFYEVQAGARSFCVWLYKRQRGLCFRFMDGGYDRKMVIEGTSVRAEADLMAKATELNVKVERAIYNFKDYRDILYGENRAMRRYTLLQGVPNYSTIPRTISNIFLNANLDGGYIKKTIIDSLSDETVEINLEANRHHLDTARSHYADVSEYLRNEVPAAQIVSAYEAVLDLEERQRATAWKVGAAYQYAREQQRVLEEQITDKAKEEQDQREKLKAIQGQYETEKRRLGDRLAQAKKDIERANEKKRHYADLGIEKLLVEALEVPRLEQELSHSKEQRAALTARAEQQEAQFQIVLQKLENKHQAFVQQVRSALSDFKDANYAELDAARRQADEQGAELTADFEENCGGLRKERSAAEEERNSLKLKLRALDHTPLFEEERAQLTDRGQELAREQVRLEERQKQATANVEALQREATDRQKLEQAEGDNRLRPLLNERESLRNILSGQQSELDRLSGSLLEFLDAEVDGWQETLGKTVRRDVLLHSGLEPRKTEGKSLFGIDLRLEHLESDDLSKSSLEAAMVETEKALELLAGRIEKQLDENRAEADRMLQQYNRKVSALRDEGKGLATELFSVEQNLERQAIAVQELAEKTVARRLELQREVEQQLHTVGSTVKDLEGLIAGLTEQHASAQKRLQDDLNRRLRQLAKALKKQQALSDEKVAGQEARLIEQTERLNAERTSALKKAGVDAQKVAALDRQVQEFKAALESIRQNETVRIEYAKDKREWMDRLPEFQRLRVQLEEKLEQLSERFGRRIQQEKKRLETIEGLLKSLNHALQQVVDEMKAFESFERDELFAVFESFIRHHDVGESADCRERIGELKDLAWQFEKQFKQMTERITAFSGLFNEGNCLGFEVHLAGEASFRTFAEVLASFVREQKIITLKTEVTKKYSMVLSTIVTETNRLLQREGEVQRVVTKINRDFRASNFVGVVHSIEMRVQESGNRIFQVLREICRFQENHQMNFGEIDLFNRGDSGNDEKAVELLDQLRNQMSQTKNSALRLEDALELEFRVCENENDTNWVSRLANVGSNGTDVLVKSMIYINLLNIFKAAGRNQGDATQLHCLVDEVGILHDSNVKSLIHFAAERGICMINGSPNSHNEQDYRHIYMFRKEKSQTAITKLISHASQ